MEPGVEEYLEKDIGSLDAPKRSDALGSIWMAGSLSRNCGLKSMFGFVLLFP
jgi:hypothetical protein